MNKYIEQDITSGFTYLKCAIMNILDALDKEEINSYTFNSYISINLIIKYLKEANWTTKETFWISPSERKFKFKNNSLQNEKII